MSAFKVKMHQNRFLNQGSLQRSPDPLAGIKGTYFYGKWRGAGTVRGKERGRQEACS